jgi:hypothetical protein
MTKFSARHNYAQGYRQPGREGAFKTGFAATVRTRRKARFSRPFGESSQHAKGACRSEDFKVVDADRQIFLEFKRVAGERKVPIGDFIAAAFDALREPPVEEPLSPELERDVAWYESHEHELRERYPVGTVVAIYDADVLDADPDAAQLMRRIRTKIGRESVFMPEIGEEELPLIHFRSPHYVR